MNVKYPNNTHNHKSYHVYYRFPLSLFKASSLCKVKMFDPPDKRFRFYIEDNLYSIDGSDGDSLNENQLEILNKYKTGVFKFHWNKEKHYNIKNLYQFSPISFYDWDEYFKLEKSINYTCNSNVVLNNQRIWGNAIKRRTYVREILSKNTNVDFNITERQEFWNKINNCLVSVCIPGFRNNMLDRGQLQYMAFGACTISPHLETFLPNDTELKDGVHYIVCKDDYSDLIQKIEWCKNNRQKCVEIGKNAKKMFLENCTPDAVVSYMKKCLNK